MTTPRAEWAEEDGSLLDDALFGGSSKADGHSSDGAKLSLGESGLVNGSQMVPTTADMVYHDETRCIDGLGGSTCLDSGVAQRPRRSAFGKPSTKVCRLRTCQDCTSRCSFCLSTEVIDWLSGERKYTNKVAAIMLLRRVHSVVKNDAARQNRRSSVQNPVNISIARLAENILQRTLSVTHQTLRAWCLASPIQ